MAGYSNRTLAEKLGIRTTTTCLIINAPDGYISSLNIEIKQLYTSYSHEEVEMIQFFTSSKEELIREIPRLLKHMSQDGMLWISWPKKASGVKTDLDENIIRAIGLSSRVVDVKVIAIDEIWSALKFVSRLRDRS